MWGIFNRHRRDMSDNFADLILPPLSAFIMSVRLDEIVQKSVQVATMLFYVTARAVATAKFVFSSTSRLGGFVFKRSATRRKPLHCDAMVLNRSLSRCKAYVYSRAKNLDATLPLRCAITITIIILT